MGPTTYPTRWAQSLGFRASDEFDEEGKNVHQKIQFPKSICFAGFGDIEICVQILCKKTVLPLTLEKQGFETSNRDGVNTKVVGYNEINQMELKHKFSEYLIIPQIHVKTLQRNPQRVLLIKKALKIPQSYIKAFLIPKLNKIH